MGVGNFIDDLLKPTGYRTIEYLPSSPWAPDDMVHNQMDCMIIMNVFHVYRIPCIDTSVKGRTQKSPNAQAPPLKGRPIHPRLNRLCWLMRLQVEEGMLCAENLLVSSSVRKS